VKFKVLQKVNTVLIASCSLKLRQQQEVNVQKDERSQSEHPIFEFQKYNCRSEGKQIRESSLTSDIVSFQPSSSTIRKHRMTASRKTNFEKFGT